MVIDSITQRYLNRWRETKHEKADQILQVELINNEGELEKIFFKIPELFEKYSTTVS